MRYIGPAIKTLRARLGQTQEQMAGELGITSVHLSNLENNRSKPSAKFLERAQEIWGVDLYVLSWCEDADLSKLPEPLRAIASDLHRTWSEQLETAMKTTRKKRAGRSCSVSTG